MTAITWLLKELEKVNYHPTEAMIIYAKKLEKQQIIDAFNSSYDVNLGQFVNGDYTIGESYYNETYGSKGSDETKTK